MQRDSERIARQWNREIEDEMRRAAQREAAGARWRAVAWGGLWLLWLTLLAILAAYLR